MDPLQDVEAQIAELERLHASLVAAEAGSNADDEHDPEGQTLAFERQQLVAVLTRARHKREEILRGPSDGRCAVCGGEIGAERLAARPYASTCVTCASRA